jgi:4-amino-4-deoxy-L-arabinose transferase-like glycosyltransferase
LFFVQALNVHGIEYRDDEVFYYKSTQQMLATGDYLTPKYFQEHRFQKPILFYWLVLTSYKIFGANWFAARFVSVIFAALCVVLTWSMAQDFFGRRAAWLSSVILMTIPLFFRHAKNVVPDMALNFFTVAAIWCAIKFVQDPTRRRYSVLFFLSCALGFMIKGFVPVVIPMIFLILYALMSQKARVLIKINFPLGLLIMAVVILPWFLSMIKIHGAAYLDYILVQETKQRMVSADQNVNFLARVFRTFLDNGEFYLGTLATIFQPWFVFFLCSIPTAFVHIAKRTPDSQCLKMLLVWFISGFIFFSSIFGAMSHYILVLTTPFAILTGYFLGQVLPSYAFRWRFLNFTRKVLLEIFFVFSVSAYTFLLIFLKGAHGGWLFLILFLLAGVLIMMHRSRDPFVAPMVLGLFLVFVFSQSGMIAKTGLAAHASLQKFADTLKKDLDGRQYMITVGSHDIHEKEWQVYFDVLIEKCSTNNPDITREMLYRVFQENYNVYCLITEKDYNTFFNAYANRPMTTLSEDYVVRKRMSLDKNFFAAILKMDRETIRDYLKEKVVLVKMNGFE